MAHEAVTCPRVGDLCQFGESPRDDPVLMVGVTVGGRPIVCKVTNNPSATELATYSFITNWGLLSVAPEPEEIESA